MLTAFVELQRAILEFAVDLSRKSLCRCRVDSKRARIAAMKTAMPQFLIAVLIVCFASVQNAQAVNPPPDGGYSGGNTAEGQDALLHLTTGVQNTAVGFSSLKINTTGSYNTAIGSGTLRANIGDGNTATGTFALLSNTNGRLNTANGALALISNTNGIANTAVGYSALFSNTAGLGNTAVGDEALRANTTGDANIAIGSQALIGNSTGGGNTAVGYFALYHNTSGIRNIALGFNAGHLTTGSDNVALGADAGKNRTTGDHNIDIGNQGVAAEGDTIRIGTQGTQTATYVAGIFGASATNGAPVLVDSSGKLGTVISSARFKEDIKSMDKVSESILALKPVTFQYKTDNTATPQFGLVAEEVAKVNPDLVVRNRNGEIYSVRYEAVNAMLLNEFLKEHKTVQQQGQTIARLEKQLETVTATLQKVSAQLELSKSAPQTVLNNQ
jgi:hypothetical protein